MESCAGSDMEIIDKFEAVRLLINTYLIKKVKSLNKPIHQEKFVDNVRKEFKDKGYNYPRKRILYTWKYLLDNYQFYKKNHPNEEARRLWAYFSLMDNCFDNSKQTSEKFKDEKWTFFLIKSLNKYKSVLLNRGLTMELLQIIEDNFRKAGNDDVNQKDLYNQWVFLKRFYRQNQKTGYYKQLSKNQAYFTALKTVFETDLIGDSSVSPNVSQNELVSAIESIKEDEIMYAKRQKTNCEIKPCMLPSENLTVDVNVSGSGTVPFTSVMHDILLQCLKKVRVKIQDLNGRIDQSILNEAVREFQKQGYNVTQESIANEWNDLSCRYELIKNTEQPQKWPYYNDMNCIYNVKDVEVLPSEDLLKKSTTGNIIIENLRENLKCNNHYTNMTKRLLNVYQANNSEFLKIKDILVERNLLKEEANYLLNALIDKLNKE